MAAYFERATTVVLCVCAIGITIVALRRNTAPVQGQQTTAKPRFIPEWRDLVRAGRIIAGDSAAPVKVIEFADLECPFCRQFQSTIHEAVKGHSKDVAFIFIHFPLTSHRFARPAARAAECADSAHFGEMVDAIYRFQDSIGLRPWTWFANIAGVTDIQSFSICQEDSRPRPSIEVGRALGARFEINATPSVVVNGWLYPGLSSTGLEKAIAAAKEGKAASKTQ